MINAIFDRRSIRKYKADAVPKEMIEQIIKSGIAAPSPKNRQPWRFVVASGKSREDALCAMQMGLEREKHEPLLTESAHYLSGAENTLRIMRQLKICRWLQRNWDSARFGYATHIFPIGSLANG